MPAAAEFLMARAGPQKAIDVHVYDYESGSAVPDGIRRDYPDPMNTSSEKNVAIWNQ
jgi:hypothetical protein